jgi:hypothetical protein
MSAPKHDTTVTLSVEMRRALLNFQVTMDAARAAGAESLNAVRGPTIFGEAAGGGRRFVELTPEHLRAIGNLYVTLALKSAPSSRISGCGRDIERASENQREINITVGEKTVKFVVVKQANGSWCQAGNWFSEVQTPSITPFLALQMPSTTRSQGQTMMIGRR